MLNSRRRARDRGRPGPPSPASPVTVVVVARARVARDCAPRGDTSINIHIWLGTARGAAGGSGGCNSLQTSFESR